MAIGIGTFDEIGLIAVADKQALELLVADSSQHRRIGDLVAVQVQDGQHRPVADGVEKLVGVPGRCQGPGLSLAIAHHDRNDQIGIIEGRPEGMGEAVAQLASLMNRAGSLGSAVAADAAGEGELS